MNGSFSEALVVLLAPPMLEDVIIDWLLSRVDGTGFTSFPVFGHGAGHQHLAPIEQVTGRQRRIQFQLQMPQRLVNGFLADAGAEFGAAGVHYWVIPLAVSGRLSQI